MLLNSFPDIQEAKASVDKMVKEAEEVGGIKLLEHCRSLLEAKLWHANMTRELQDRINEYLAFITEGSMWRVFVHFNPTSHQLTFCRTRRPS